MRTKLSLIFTLTAAAFFSSSILTASAQQPPTIEGNRGVPGLLNQLEDATTTIEEQQAIIERLRRMAPVPRTGQTTSYAPGDDGDIQAGVAWPNPRFTINVNESDDDGSGGGIAGNGICDGYELCNGTVTDHLTGLVWLRNADCTNTVCTDIDPADCVPGQHLSWADALDFANNLASGDCGLSDGSEAGDWRMPNIREQLSLVDYGNISTLPAGHPFTNVPVTGHWTSTSIPYDAPDDYAYYVDTNRGFVGYVRKDNYYGQDPYYGLPTWPVRDGQ